MQMLDPHGQNKSGDNRNMFAAVAIAAIVILGYEYISSPKAEGEIKQEIAVSEKTVTTVDGTAMPGAPENLHAEKVALAKTDIPTSAPTVERVAIKSNLFDGSISLKGGRVDSLSLPQYKVELKEDAKITLFHSGGDNAHFFDVGWLSGGAASAPDGNTLWRAEGSLLSESKPLTLIWNNTTGQIFKRIFTLGDDSYTINVTDSVTNKSNVNTNLTHYAQIHKALSESEEGGGIYDPEASTFYNFLGPMGIVDDIRVEADYDDLKDASVKKSGLQGWTGITSRYFMAALVPDQITEQTFLWRHTKTAGRDFYTTVMQPESMNVAAGQTITYNYTLYAGPKASPELTKVSGHLDKAVDYGWFDIIARPVYIMVMWFYGIFGNFGLAIIFATLVLKTIMYPLAYKSYSAMAKMRKLQPRLTQLKERYADNKEQFALEMMGLYKEHKVNPLSGCWPTFIQIPIFFAFYKVILISFEFRQAPLALWIEDMSVMDPYYVLPILMGISMMLQMRLSPTSADPNQQMMIKIMPIVFTFMFLWFPSGLVLYWLTNNVISILQQLYVMKKLA